MAGTINLGLELRKTVMEDNHQRLCEERIQFCLAISKGEKELAANIKDELDKTIGGAFWNVVVGKDFGSHVFHKSKFFAHYRVSDIEIIVWKTEHIDRESKASILKHQ